MDWEQFVDGAKGVLETCRNVRDQVHEMENETVEVGDYLQFLEFARSYAYYGTLRAVNHFAEGIGLDFRFSSALPFTPYDVTRRAAMCSEEQIVDWAYSNLEFLMPETFKALFEQCADAVKVDVGTTAPELYYADTLMGYDFLESVEGALDGFVSDHNLMGIALKNLRGIDRYEIATIIETEAVDYGFDESDLFEIDILVDRFFSEFGELDASKLPVFCSEFIRAAVMSSGDVYCLSYNAVHIYVGDRLNTFVPVNVREKLQTYLLEYEQSSALGVICVSADYLCSLLIIAGYDSGNSIMINDACADLVLVAYLCILELAVLAAGKEERK